MSFDSERQHGPRPMPARRRRSDREPPAPPANPDRVLAPAAAAPLMTIAQVREALQCSAHHVHNLIARRELRALRIPGRSGAKGRAHWRIFRDSFEDFLARNTYDVRPLPWFSTVGRKKHGTAN